MAALMTLRKLLGGVDYEIRRGGQRALDRQVHGVSDDSRQLRVGDIFVALRGRSGDTLRHLADALERGCRILAMDGGMVAQCPTPPGTVVVVLADPRAALGTIAANFHGQPSKKLQLIGITGTNGKTTTCYLLEGALRDAGHRPGVIGTVNYRYQETNGGTVALPARHTTPGPVVVQRLLQEMVSAGVTHVVMEVSSHALHQQRLSGILFDVAVFTNLSRDHLDYHATWEEYFASKLLLFTEKLRHGGTAVVLASSRPDDPKLPGEERSWGLYLCQRLREMGFGEKKNHQGGKGRMLVCGDGPASRLRAEAVVESREGLRCTIRHGNRSAVLSSPLVGRHNLENLLCAAGAALACGLTLPQACRGLAAVQRVPGRLEQVRLAAVQAPVEAASLPAVFVDYAHSPDALAHVLATLRELPHRRLVCVFGCGGDRDRGKRPQMGKVAAQLADRVILTSDNPRGEAPEAILAEISVGVRQENSREEELENLIYSCARRAYAVEPDRRRAIRAAVGYSGPDDLVLLAGKGHECTQVAGGAIRPFDDRLEAASALAQWRFDRLLAATGGSCMAAPNPAQFLSGRILTDSRAVEPGDVFVALRGDRFDGHDFLTAAVRAGAGIVLAEHAPADLPSQAILIKVPDTLAALGDLAAFRRRLLSGALRRIAITGSSGKTTVKEMCAAICALHLGTTTTGEERVLKTQGNFNNLIGLPLTLLGAEPWHRLAVLEMGMNRPGEIARLTAIADPDIACINNVQPAHLLGLGSVAGVADAKGELFRGLGKNAVLAVNLDDAHVRALARERGQRQIPFSLEPRRRAQAAVRATRLESLGSRGSRLTLHIEDWRERFTLPVPGRHNVMNALAAAALAHAADVPPDTVAAALAAYQPVDKRMQQLPLASGAMLLNDAYNANPASMRAALETVAAFSARHRVALLGDMLELGGEAPAAHRDIGALAAWLGYDYLAAVGDFAATVTAAARKEGMRGSRLCCCADHAVMAGWIRGLISAGKLGAGDWIVLKGSRSMRMEQLLDVLEPVPGGVNGPRGR